MFTWREACNGTDTTYVPGGPSVDPCFHLCSVIPRGVGQGGPSPELCWGNGLGPVVLTLGKGDPYLPLEATGYFHCLFAGTARTTWTISQAWGMEGPPTFHKAHRAPRCGLQGGTHHCRLDSLRHIITLKQDSCIKQSPPGPTHTPSLYQAPLRGSTGGGPLVALLSAQAHRDSARNLGLARGTLSTSIHLGNKQDHQGHKRHKVLAILPARPV